MLVSCSDFHLPGCAVVIVGPLRGAHSSEWGSRTGLHRCPPPHLKSCRGQMCVDGSHHFRCWRLHNAQTGTFPGNSLQTSPPFPTLYHVHLIFTTLFAIIVEWFILHESYASLSACFWFLSFLLRSVCAFKRSQIKGQRKFGGI